MKHAELVSLARSGRWKDLEQQWLAAIEDTATDVSAEDFLIAIELTVKAGQAALAETMAWAWLSEVKTRCAADEALGMARELLLRLPAGDQLREEVLGLYRQTHVDQPDLEEWIRRSGLAAGKSVKRALRFLDVGLQLEPGTLLLNRTEDEAAELLDMNLSADETTIRTARHTQTLRVEQIIDAYDVADPEDFRVLSQLRPERIRELLTKDPCALLIGIAHSRRDGQIDRDELKLLLSPRYLSADQWGGWWNKARDAIKQSNHLRVEGRSPMMIMYEPGGMTLEDETWGLFNKADSAREWLELVEGYLRETKRRKTPPDHAFLERVQTTLVGRAQKLSRHDPRAAFAVSLVIERLANEGLPVHPEARGLAVAMLQAARHPVDLLVDLPDAALWALGIAVVPPALPDRWATAFADLLLRAPLSQLDVLASGIEEAGHGERLPHLVQQALTAPGEYVDLLMWVWRGPNTKTTLSIPPRTELLAKIMAMIGPARERSGGKAGADVTATRAKVRAGLSARDYAGFEELMNGIDEAMAAAVRRQIERAEGLGPVLQEEMLDRLRGRFPGLVAAKAQVPVWEQEGILYVTSKGLSAKEAELNELVNVKMRENAKAIGAAAEHGDLSENSEYKFALEERDLLRARLAQINLEMSMARVLEPEDVPSDHVGIGHRVFLDGADSAGEASLTILGPWESDLSRRIYSYQTPLAKRLLGRKAGETVVLVLDEKEQAYRIKGFEPVV